MTHKIGRRDILKTIVGAPTFAATATLVGCGDGGACASTTPDVEGPFYTANAPTRIALAEAGESGERITISGRILDASDCATGLGGYIVDLWHSNSAGVYDNSGFNLRGKFAVGTDGSFSIETIKPGTYPDRPVLHIHVKIRRPDGTDQLTTQIYFEGDPQLSSQHVGPRVRLVDGAGQINFIVPA